MTLAPSLASSNATARPVPRPAPVTMPARPSRFIALPSPKISCERHVVSAEYATFRLYNTVGPDSGCVLGMRPVPGHHHHYPRTTHVMQPAGYNSQRTA